MLLDLARRADVFLTSFLPGHRQKFGIDVDDIRAHGKDERLPVKSFYDGVEFYYKFLKAVTSE